MHRLPHRWLVRLAALLVGAASAGAADLIEPWSPGWTDLELFASATDGAPSTVATTLGFGAGGGLSVGVTWSGAWSEASELGLLLVWSGELAGWGELDLFAEANAAAREVELTGLGRAFGCEWSRAAGAERTPYLRLTAHRESGDTRWHPLVGYRLAWRRIDLHLELSAEQPEPGGRWPLHLAIGPNLTLGDGFEIVPELSLLLDREGGDLSAAWSLGVVTSPAALGALLGRPAARD